MRSRTLVRIAFWLGLAAGPALAGDLAVPEASDTLVLDGVPAEAAWDAAARPAVESLADGTRPEVHLLVAGERLWVAASVEQAPGPGVGLALMIAPDGVERAADALAVGFSPQSVRAPRWTVHGPRGAGRTVYRVEGALDASAPDRWSAELAVPLADLGLEDAAAPLRVAVVVKSRVPGHAAWAPADAAWRGPAAWSRLVPGAPWPRGEVAVDGAALAEADARDDDRLYAWASFLAAYQAQIESLLEATGHTFLGLEDADRKEVVLDTLRQLLVAPLEEVHALRPDLAYAYVIRGGVLHQMGLEDEARDAYAAALERMPGLREARFGLFVALLGPSFLAAPAGGPTDYETAFLAADAAEPTRAEGTAFGRGLLHLARGDFREAHLLLEPLAVRYPFQQSIVYAAQRARRGSERWPIEQRYRQVEAEQGDLPRVRLVTSAGEIVLELFEDDASNTVKNFVWLVKHGFYDGAPVGSTIPFLQAGIAAGDPGWAVVTQRPPSRQRVGGGEPRRRLPFRGTVAMLAPAPDAAAARFALLTGTATDLESDVIPFGRVLEGLDVVDALKAGDRIEKAAVVRSRPGTDYRPLTVKGTPAPAPR